MNEHTLDPRLHWRPWPAGDPMPDLFTEIWELLNPEQRLDIAKLSLETSIKVQEQQLAGLKQAQKYLAGVGRS